MKADALLNAIGDAREEYINDVREYQTRKDLKTRRFFQRPAAIAAAFAIALTLAMPVRAELTNGYVSNLLAPLYGNARTEIVDRIGKPINASVAVGAYTLTADAVIGDQYNMAIVYSLRRTDGGKIEKRLCFENYHNTAKQGIWGGSYISHLSGDKRVLYIVEEWTAADRLRLNRKATATFTNLIFYNKETKEKDMIEEGSWQLKFTVRYEDSGVRIPVDDIAVEDGSGEEYTIHKIVLSPIGLHLDMTAPNFTSFDFAEESPLQHFNVSVILDDGRVIPFDNKNLSFRADSEENRHKADFGAMFDEPIPLDQVKELVICGTSFALAD